MAVLRPKSYTSSQFTWVPGQKLFVAEASSLGPGNPFSQVYDDACDEGLTLVSTKPGLAGREIVFAVENTEAKNGDILWWDLKAVKPRQGPGFSLRVYND
jgi:hypothetical protein